MPRKKITEKQCDYIFAVGRRKEAVARIHLFPKGKGQVMVNEKPAQEYFPGETTPILYLKPFVVTGTLEKFDVSAKVVGGGLQGQLGAVTHGITRALEKYDKEKFRPLLKKEGLLTRDSRAKERRKAGYAHKARAKKQSPKR